MAAAGSSATDERPYSGGWLQQLAGGFDAAAIYWPTVEGFVLETESEGMTERGYYFESHRFRASEHGGTHVDAPIHFAEGRHTVDEIPLDRFLGPARVLDVYSQYVVRGATN